MIKISYYTPHSNKTLKLLCVGAVKLERYLMIEKHVFCAKQISSSTFLFFISLVTLSSIPAVMLYTRVLCFYHRYPFLVHAHIIIMHYVRRMTLKAHGFMKIIISVRVETHKIFEILSVRVPAPRGI